MFLLASSSRSAGRYTAGPPGSVPRAVQKVSAQMWDICGALAVSAASNAPGMFLGQREDGGGMPEPLCWASGAE